MFALLAGVHLRVTVTAKVWNGLVNIVCLPKNQKKHLEQGFKRLLYHKSDSLSLSVQEKTVEVSDWRKNVEAMSGMEGRKKMFDVEKGANQ